jgi:hypothetical protein
MRKKRFSLAKVERKIELYRKAHAGGFFSKPSILAKEDAFLSKIQNDLQEIFTVNRDWLKDGLIAKAMRDEQAAADLTQAALNEEAGIAYLEKIAYTWFRAKQIIQAVDDEEKQHASAAYRDFLAQIQDCLAKAIAPLQQHVVKENETTIETKLEEGAQETFFQDPLAFNPGRAFIGDHSTLLCHLLGGRYLPFKQAYDPLCGAKEEQQEDLLESDGAYCYGHVMQWAKDIAEKGYAQTIGCADKQVFMQQKQQLQTRFYQHHNLFSLHFNEQTPLLPLISQIVNALDEQHLYSLSFQYEHINHRTSLRRIPNSSSIEFFDPNQGTFVFDDREIFKYWLSYFLCHTYFMEEAPADDHGPRHQPTFSLSYVKGLTQSPSAKASIPPLAADDEEKKTIKAVHLFHLLKKDIHFHLLEDNSIAQLRYIQSMPAQPCKQQRRSSAFHILSMLRQEKELFEINHGRCLENLAGTYYHLRQQVFLHFKQGYQLEHIEKTTNNPFFTADKIDAESNLEKKTIQKIIKTEKKRLNPQHFWFGKTIAAEKQAALKKLKAEVKTASSTIPLATIIQHWQKTYGQVIAKPRTWFGFFTGVRSQQFIDDLARHQEISVYQKNLAYEKTLVHLLAELKEDAASNDIKNILLRGFASGETLKKMLEEINIIKPNTI